MAQISVTRRLAMGLGVIAVGVLGALPFRLAPSEMTVARQLTQSHTTLGEGVALQVPGQTAVAGLQNTSLQPLSAEDEPEETVTETVVQPAMVEITPPPRLPDHYRPLFHPDASHQTGMGRVVDSSTEEATIEKPVKTHTIHDGDTLALLAQRYLGDPQRASELLEANRSVLTDPAVLPIGVQIVIPRESEDVGTPTVAGTTEPQVRTLVPLPALGFRRSR